MKVYVASSWRNNKQPSVVNILKGVGHEVYDFHHPSTGDDGFHWTEVWEQFDDDWHNGTMEQFIEALKHPVAISGFNKDMFALRMCDACVLVLPCNRSAHLELGYAVGVGKITIIMLDSDCEPELMYSMVDRLCVNITDVVNALEGK